MVGLACWQSGYSPMAAVRACRRRDSRDAALGTNPWSLRRSSASTSHSWVSACNFLSIGANRPITIGGHILLPLHARLFKLCRRRRWASRLC